MVGVEGLDCVAVAVGVMGVTAGDCTLERGGKTANKHKNTLKDLQIKGMVLVDKKR